MYELGDFFLVLNLKELNKNMVKILNYLFLKKKIFYMVLGKVIDFFFGLFELFMFFLI